MKRSRNRRAALLGTARRSPQRGDTDTAGWLAAWDAAQADLAAHPQAQWELRVDTDATAPREAAERIDDTVRATAPSSGLPAPKQS
ncbi:hypothetical protein [Streptomyces sp. 4N124]|uniref:hypothetical protein n=1 Tax=Streptomyces sp. 4N124 TaxID=3457420 RepID=UPI003FD28D66